VALSPGECPSRFGTRQEGMTTHRSGVVALVGRPNVGKSTLLNTILGQKLSIVTSKPQTTRNRILGIKTLPDAQIIFIDTPGIHTPRHKLGELMVREAREALKEVDIGLLLVDPRLPGKGERDIIESFGATVNVVFLVINKIDTVRKESLLPVIDAYRALYPFKEIVPISALAGDGVDTLLAETVARLPEGPRYYPDDMVTDRLERFLVSEIIREKITERTEQEVPHSVAVEVAEWSERAEGVILIGATIYIERESQKGIIIGKKGLRLKAVGIEARREIEGLLGAQVFLKLWVKVRKDWRSDGPFLKELGFTT